MPTVRLTLAPGLSFLPGFGFCASTRPFLRAADAFLVTLPTAQCALLILAFAFLSVSPITFGTTHLALKLAVVVVLAVSDNVHAAVPWHAPLQPLKIEREDGFAVSFTEAPNRNENAHVPGQLMPAGKLVIRPVPVPALRTVSVRGCSVKVAVTLLSDRLLTVQAPAPEQAPDQPLKVDPVAGAAVSVTLAPSAKDAAQETPQLIPPGVDAIVPAPLPALAAASVHVGPQAGNLNFAIRVCHAAAAVVA